MSDQNTSLKQKTERKNVQNSLSYGRKTSFEAILKIAAILKTYERTSLFFQKFKAFIYL
jgi:hypothetical protein